MKSLIQNIIHFGDHPGDSFDTRLKKTLLVLSSIMMASLAIVWGLLYFALGAFLAGSIPLFYSLLSILSITAFTRTRSYRFLRSSQLTLSLLLPFFLMMALGGFANSSGVILWSLSSPLGALVFAQRQQAILWFIAFMALVLLGIFVEPFVTTTNHIPLVVRTLLFAMNIGGSSMVVFILLQYFVSQKDATVSQLHAEQAKSESLLLNILPKKIADALKNEYRVIAEKHDEVSVLFADIVNFTQMSAQMTPVELVELLNEVFSYFDSLVARHHVEKIKTIGDCYMAAAGIPQFRSDHAQTLAGVAIEARNHFARNAYRGRFLDFRMGIHSGPVVAGVIGNTKFAYDLWGDAVNTASRMESNGKGGEIQITRSTYDLIKDEFICEPKGMVSVKGKGEMEVWHIKKQNPSPPPILQIQSGNQ